MKKNTVSDIYYHNIHDTYATRTGLHMCCFSNEPAFSLQTDQEFVLSEVKEGHKIIYIASEEKKGKVIRFLQKEHIDPAVWTKNRQLSFFSASEVYTHKGVFSLEAVRRFWQQQLEDSQSTALRAIIDMDWSLDTFVTLEDVIQYEATIAENISQNPQVMFVCLYDASLLPQGFLNKAIESHPFCKYENNIYPNPYFISPKEYLAPDKEEKLFKQRSHEIKERRKIDEEFVRLYKKIEELDQFSHMIAHDIKEPVRLANMLNDIILLEHQKELPEATQDLVTRVSKALQEAHSRVEGLKELNTQSKNAHNTLLALDKAILQNVKEYEKQLKEVKGKIVYNPALEAHAQVNEVYFSQLFSNIIGNSIKYRKKDVPLVITIETAMTHPDKIDVKITDNGQGFNARYNTQIFRPFRRLHSSLEYEGNGIGLTICQRIMQESGGEILAEGQEGVGATVTLRFPLVDTKENNTPYTKYQERPFPLTPRKLRSIDKNTQDDTKSTNDACDIRNDDGPVFNN